MGASIETAAFEHLESHYSPDVQVNGLKFDVNIETFKDYTIFIPNSQSAGTKISLKLKPEVEMDAVYVSIQRQVICSKVPINLIVLNERISSLPKSPLPLNSEELFEARIATANVNEVQLFRWTSTKEDVEVALTLAFRVDKNENLTFLMKDKHQSILELMPRLNQPIVSVCGFTVPLQLGSMAWDLGRVGHVSVNITNPGGIKYRLDRRSLLPSPEQDRASMIANELIHQGYREFLKQQRGYRPDIIYYLNMQSRMHGGEVFDSYTKKRLVTARNCYEDLCCFKFIKVNRDVDFKNAERSYFSLKDLSNMGISRVVVCQHSKFSAPNRLFEPENVLPIVYEIQKNKLDNIPTYIMEPIAEASMLFDNSKEANIYVQPVKLGHGILDLLMMEMLVSELNAEQHSWVVAEISGKWSGTIYERPIISPLNNENFVFLGRYRLVVQTKSRLANVIRELVAEGRKYAVTELIVSLKEASNGHLDSKFLEDWPELFHSCR